MLELADVMHCSRTDALRVGRCIHAIDLVMFVPRNLAIDAAGGS